MKKSLLFFAVCTILMASCGGKATSDNTANEASNTNPTSQQVNNAPTLEIEDIYLSGDTLIDKDVIVTGTVTHTCKHAGKKCFLVGKDGKASLRVEAKGEIGGFNKELVGSQLAIKGKLRGNKLSKEYIDQQEKLMNEKIATKETTEENCQVELNNFATMKQWMQDNNKEFYVVYYMDGESFNVVE